MSTASFNKKPKSTIQQRKSVKITYILFWVNWLPDHAQNMLEITSPILLDWLKQALGK